MTNTAFPKIANWWPTPSYVVVLPSIHQPWTDACLASCQIPAEHILVVDNTVTNRGVAASWNLGIDRMQAQGADWLIVLSAGVRFGVNGGLDFLRELIKSPQAMVVEAGEGIGWHLIAFPSWLIAKAGRFDENFWPAYYEDIDYGYRIRLAVGYDEAHPWHKPSIDVSLEGVAHGLKLGRVEVDIEALGNYMERKWGHRSLCHFTHPFDDPSLPIDFWQPGAIRGVA